MKNIQNKALLAVVTFCLCSIGFTSCKTDEVSLELPRLFRPINLSVDLNKTVATISWAKVDSAVSYTLEVSTDSINFSSPVVDTTVTKLSFSKELAGETKFFARVRSNALDTAKISKYSTALSFKTPAENLFLGYGTDINIGKPISAYMTDLKTLTIKWTPGANVSHLILTNSDASVRDSVAISPAELAAGQKIVTESTNSKWTVKIYNTQILRGTTYGMIEGDIILAPGANLATELTNAAPGQVILLTGNAATYSIGSASFNFSKNVKIRSLSSTSRAVVCMTGATTTANMFGVVLNSAIDSLVFENIDFSGYCDNNTTSTKIGYLYSNKVASTVGSMKYINCNIHNFGNTPMRLSGGTQAASQHIANLSYNGCIIRELGFSSGYGIVNISKSYDYIDNISISNSTIYNFSYPVISIVQTAATAMNSVTITNCTFNQAAQNVASTRALFNFDYIVIAKGVAIKNCIFGSSGAVTAGMKITNTSIATTVNTNTGSYFTSDYYDEGLIAGLPFSIKSSMKSYSGLSTALWVDPINGNFNLLDTGFAGKGTSGDLRTY